ncbi:MAG: DNA-processing protein DprA [Clostridia bacterium]|nr:DNA-processing protein DprA [Clostridia bacterium]
MEYEIKEQYRIWLASVRGMTPRKYKLLMETLEDAQAIWDNPDSAKDLIDEKTFQQLKKARAQEAFIRLFYTLDKSGITALSSSHADYPESLLDLFDPPPVLYVRGSIEILKEEKMLAVVGTRTPTFDGKKTASEFVKAISEEDVVIVSGLARGIDTIAHESCIQSGGRTIAVLGSGLNSMYPPENAELCENIIQTGGAVVSEMPPDEGPQKWSFPARNRIIAALSKGVLIIEGKKTSGAMITAANALDLSRDIYAIPGSIYARLSEGPNHLIQNGAFPALSPWDILEAERWGVRPGEKQDAKKKISLNENETVIVNLLEIQPLSFDEISKQTQFSSSTLNSLLTMLVLRGIIIKTPGNSYRII